MPRIGTNPARKKIMQYTPEKVTAAIMVYIPEQAGYFQQRWQIFTLCINSLKANTKIPFDMLVLANGCSQEIVEKLREIQKTGEIDYLIIPRKNLGVIGGYKTIFNAAPGEIVAYCDDDIVFYPGWLESQLEILDLFPQVGMVSGVPVRDGASHASGAIERFLAKKPKSVFAKHERKIPDEWEIDWCISTGRDPEEHLRNTAHLQELVITKDGVDTIASANHFQFVAPKAVIQKALPQEWSRNLMDSLVPLEEAVDGMDYLRLSTTGRYCRHVGNTISPELAQEFAVGLKQAATDSQPKASKHWLLRIPGMGRMFWKLYDWLFKILNQVD